MVWMLKKTMCVQRLELASCKTLASINPTSLFAAHSANWS